MSDSKPAEELKEPAPALAPAPETKKPAEDTVGDASSSDDYVGKRVSKKFATKNYYGEIKEKWTEKNGAPKWHVMYDDGDEEDFNQKELDSALKRYERNKRYDFKIFPRKPRKPSEKKKRKIIDPAPPRTSKFPKRGSSKKANVLSL